jgi:hypothetical protein
VDTLWGVKVTKEVMVTVDRERILTLVGRRGSDSSRRCLETMQNGSFQRDEYLTKHYFLILCI